MVYQEQVMQVARDLAGFTMAEADHLRKGIAKKQLEKLASMKTAFKDGAVAGYVEVELEDGRTIKVHRKTKFSVEENDQKWTVEEIVANNYTIKDKI